MVSEVGYGLPNKSAGSWTLPIQLTWWVAKMKKTDILSSIDRLKKTKRVKLLLCCTVYEKKLKTFYLPQAFHQTAKKCLLLLWWWGSSQKEHITWINMIDNNWTLQLACSTIMLIVIQLHHYTLIKMLVNFLNPPGLAVTLLFILTSPVLPWKQHFIVHIGWKM